METIGPVFNALGAGLPVLLAQMFVTLVLLAIGATVYARITPYDERALVAKGNVAGGLSTAGALIALSVPLAATLATSHTVVDILIWGLIALILQLVAFAVATMLIKDLKAQIEAGNVAAAANLVGVQMAVALVNAAAMAG